MARVVGKDFGTVGGNGKFMDSVGQALWKKAFQCTN